MATQKASDLDATITTSQAAKLLMVSEVWINKLHKMEYVPKAGRGKWNLVSVVQGYIRFLKDDDRRSSKSAAQSRITDIKAARLEMQMKAERRELVPLEDLHFVFDIGVSAVRAQMMAVPAKFTRDVKERRRLEKMIVEGLELASAEMKGKAAILKQGGDLTA